MTMSIKEFETAIGNRILMPTINTSFNAYFNTKYTPEDMVQVMTSGSNSSYFLNKEPAGAQTFKYSTYTITLGYIYTIVSDNSTYNTKAEEDILSKLKHILKIY